MPSLQHLVILWTKVHACLNLWAETTIGLKVKRAWIMASALALAAVFVVMGVRQYTLQAKERTEQARLAAEEKTRQEAILAEQQRENEAGAKRSAYLSSLHFKADPNNELPVMYLKDLSKRLYDRRNPIDIEPDQKIRIIATLGEKNIYRDSLQFTTNPATFLYQDYKFLFLSDDDLKPLQPGDEVEFVGRYDDSENNSVPGKYESSLMLFWGSEIQKIPRF